MLHTIGETTYHRENKAQNNSLFSASYTSISILAKSAISGNKLWFAVIEQSKHGRGRITN